MERKQFIMAVSLSVAACALWFFWVRWYDKNHPQPPVVATTQPVEPATGPATTTTSATHPSVPQATSAPVMSSGLAVAPATGNGATADVLLGSANEKDPTYAMQLDLSPLGASVASVTLNDFPAPDVGKPGKGPKPRYQFEAPVRDQPSTRVLATRALVIDGKTVDLWNVSWTRESSDAGNAKFSVIVNDSESHPLVKVTKTFTLPTRPATKGKSEGFEVAVEQTIENLQPSRSLKVHAIVNGPTPPPSEVEHATDHNIVVGYDANKNITYSQQAFTELKPNAPTKDITTEKTQHFVWAGLASSYFAAIVLPSGQNNLTVQANGFNLADHEEENHSATLTFEIPDATLGDKPQTLAASVFFGPKWREVLDNDNGYYNSFPRKYNDIVAANTSWCSSCAPTALIGVLVKILVFFHWIFKDWGLAIICLVLLVRTALHPITKRSQVQMMKMGKLGPEVEKLKKKYADQPDVLNKEMMKLYKQQGGAILGCLPMFLQTPIWIALWTALQGTFELRQAPFLFNLTWIHDLAKPDMLVRFSQPIPLLIFGWHLSAINILPVLMAAVTYINQKYFMPMPIAATPEQEQQQKIQRGMSLVFPLMFYSLPSGLNIYYLTSMSLGIVESKIIRDHIKEQEEIAKKTGPEIVDAKPTRASRKGGAPLDTPPKPTGLMAKFLDAMEKAQQRAEEIRKESNKGKGKQ